MIGTTQPMAAHIKNLATLLESVAANYGMHIALTGGQLYKDGPRKDIDFVLYHASNVEQLEWPVLAFFQDLHKQGFSNIMNYGRVTKMTYDSTSWKIDILYPEFKREEMPGDASSNWKGEGAPEEHLRRQYAMFNPEDLVQRPGAVPAYLT